MPKITRKQFSTALILVLMAVLISTLFTGMANDTPITIGPSSFVETATYVVFKDGANYKSKKGMVSNIVLEDTDDEEVLQWSINATNADGGGVVYVKSADYSAAVTVKANVLLVLEPGVTGITYTVDSGGYCMRYASGYAWFDHAINMTGHEIKGGVFETGTSAPSGPSVGQWWFDTNSYTLKIYNSTDWASVEPSVEWVGAWNVTVQAIILNYIYQGSLDMNQNQILNMTFWQGTSFPDNPVEGQPFWRSDLNDLYLYNGTDWVTPEGEQGPAGPSGTIEGPQPYAYLIFENITSKYLVNGATAAIDDSSADAGYLTNSAIGNLSSNGGLIHFKPPYDSEYEFATGINVDESSITIEAEGWDTVFYANNGLNDHLIHVTATECVMRDFTINGNKAGQTSGHGILINATRSETFHLNIYNCEEDGIHVGGPNWNQACLGGKIGWCTIGGTPSNDGNGLYMDYTSSDWELTNCLIRSNSATGKAGLVIDNGNFKVNLCHFWGNYYNIILAPAHSICGVTIQTCGIRDNYQHGIYKGSSYRVYCSSITGCEFWCNGHKGLHPDPPESSASYDSIYLGDGQINSVTITGNTFVGHQDDWDDYSYTRYAINCDGATMNDCIFMGNTITAYNTTTPYVFSGSGNEIEHNTVRDCPT